VRDVALPTDQATASYETIWEDLVAMGYDHPQVKYWIYYDDRGACPCGGIGWMFHDDRPDPTNLHNGYQALHAITFGYDSVRIMLHELGHTMGAVQNSAPHSTGGLHCTDGRDIMCYNDGGPHGGAYTTSACATMVFDCGKDDYFHARPAPGSYLSTHWNLGHAWNRFLVIQP
ncbi:MAG: hypothetical protein R3185_03430, partial [Candidatus Thermoplasmatota archaeon]|nr:hypothetical protein [Candidatus Thermoplasmatota archaeon]